MTTFQTRDQTRATSAGRRVGWLATGALTAAGLVGVAAPVQAGHGGIAIAHNLRVAGHSGFDRVVIDYHGKRPSANVRFVQKLFQCGSGNRVSMPGDRIVAIKLEPAQINRPSGSIAYQGPGLRSTTNYDLKSVRGIRLVCAFEGQVVFGVGVRDNVDVVRTGFLSDPKRFYVDFRR